MGRPVGRSEGYDTKEDMINRDNHRYVDVINGGIKRNNEWPSCNNTSGYVPHKGVNEDKNRFWDAKGAESDAV
nr:hypothetical protein [Tanacetum cinerariifolium]